MLAINYSGSTCVRTKTREAFWQSETRIVWSLSMMTSSNGNIFRFTGHLCGEFTGPRWIPLHKGQWRGALMFPLICVWINGWVNNREAGDLRRYHIHYDVSVMSENLIEQFPCVCVALFTVTSLTYTLSPKLKYVLKDKIPHSISLSTFPLLIIPKHSENNGTYTGNCLRASV